MELVISIVIALVVVGALLFLVRGRSKPAIPAERAPAAPAPSPTPAKVAHAEPRPAPSDAPSAVSQVAPVPAPPPQATPVEAAEPPAVEEAPASLRPSIRAEGPLVPKVTTDGTRDQDVAAFKRGLSVTRGGFIARLAKLFSGGAKVDQALIDQAEELLLSADVGAKTTGAILDALKAAGAAGELADEAAVWRKLTSLAADILSVDSRPFGEAKSNPLVILVIGVNGVGKTTTIGKLASRFQRQGKRVLLAAGDTFRAAAVLQLEVWGRRVECPVVKGKEGADPGSVIFDAIKRAQAEGIDVVIADTAGRLHTKVPLMEELKKVSRTVSKALDRSADEVLLVLDATTGQNAVQQVQMFREAMEITGVALTKLDGTAKGGVVLGIVNEHRIPVRFVGLGEKVEDLREFDAGTFAEALFASPDASEHTA